MSDEDGAGEEGHSADEENSTPAHPEGDPPFCPGSGLPASAVEWKRVDGFALRGRGWCRHCWYAVSVNPANEAHRHPFRGIRPPSR